MELAGTRDILSHSGAVPGNPGHLVTLRQSDGYGGWCYKSWDSAGGRGNRSDDSGYFRIGFVEELCFQFGVQDLWREASIFMGNNKPRQLMIPMQMGCLQARSHVYRENESYIGLSYRVDLARRSEGIHYFLPIFIVPISLIFWLPQHFMNCFIYVLSRILL